MPRYTKITLLIVLALTAAPAFAQSAAQLAPTPPMGWNSWDAYAMSIDEADFKANTQVLAGIKQYGWQYSVIDEGWYLQDPFGADTEKQKFVYDANGRLIPALNRFPSAANGAGLKPLADYVHKQGLKFGIHLIRGIPRESVRRNTPIAGSTFTAADAGDPTDVCPWNNDNYGIKDNAAGQAWYDSIIALYAGWGVDYFKVDCISDRPYKGSEIRQIAAAIKKSGRPIVLSLSPGPTNLSHAQEVGQYAELWRISDDHWDVWHQDAKPGDASGEFPFGTRDAFARLQAWNPFMKPGNWPDDDMLPIGSLTPHPGWGEPRESRLTHDETRTEFTLWAIARSPLILGANLTKLDDFTKSLITNKEVLDMNQHSIGNHPIITLPPAFRKVRAWTALQNVKGNAPFYLALFNLDDQPVHLQTDLENITPGLGDAKFRDFGRKRTCPPTASWTSPSRHTAASCTSENTRTSTPNRTDRVPHPFRAFCGMGGRSHCRVLIASNFTEVPLSRKPPTPAPPHAHATSPPLKYPAAPHKAPSPPSPQSSSAKVSRPASAPQNSPDPPPKAPSASPP